MSHLSFKSAIQTEGGQPNVSSTKLPDELTSYLMKYR